MSILINLSLRGPRSRHPSEGWDPNKWTGFPPEFILNSVGDGNDTSTEETVLRLRFIA